MGKYLKIYGRLTPQELRQISYKEKYKKINPSWDDSLILLCQLFETCLTPKMKVLDAGCGHGNLVVDEYRSKIAKAVGVDISRKATRKNVCLDQVVIANLESLPFREDSFDVVISQWVIEHLEDPQRVFRELHRVLKKGGAFLFVTPNKTSYLVLAKRVLSIFPKITEKIVKVAYGRKERDVFRAYYRANTKMNLEKLLRRAGFKKHLLVYNGDPTYIAFNDCLFYLGVTIDKLPQLTPFRLAKPHLVGMFLK